MRKEFFLVAVIGLGFLTQKTTAQGLRPLKSLSSGLRPLQPLAIRQDTTQTVAVQQWLTKLEEEKARNLKIALIRATNLAARAKGDSLQLAEYYSRQWKQQEIGVRRPFYYPPINGNETDRFLWALAYGVPESGGNYYAKNKKTGAYGKYQFTTSTWQTWANRYAQTTGILPASVTEPTPFNQERVARFNAETLFGQYGNWRDVASVWFTGDPYYSHKNPDAVIDANGTTLRQYCDTVINGMQGK